MKLKFNKMKITSFLTTFFCAFIFLSCSENQTEIKSDSLTSPEIKPDSIAFKISPRQKITDNGLASFYVLNDVNAGTPTDEKLANWIQPFLDSLSLENIQSDQNLFNRSAGPNGAQLNPNAEILFVAFFKGKVDTASVHFKMNDFPVNKKMTLAQKINDGLTICWFLIPENRYTVMLHLPSQKETDEICAIKKLDEKTWAKNSGTVLKISAEAKADGQDVKLENYLLVTYAQ